MLIEWCLLLYYVILLGGHCFQYEVLIIKKLLLAVKLCVRIYSAKKVKRQFWKGSELLVKYTEPKNPISAKWHDLFSLADNPLAPAILLQQQKKQQSISRLILVPFKIIAKLFGTQYKSMCIDKCLQQLISELFCL